MFILKRNITEFARGLSGYVLWVGGIVKHKRILELSEISDSFKENSAISDLDSEDLRGVEVCNVFCVFDFKLFRFSIAVL